jgi:hypothetical protein
MALGHHVASLTQLALASLKKPPACLPEPAEKPEINKKPFLPSETGLWPYIERR